MCGADAAGNFLHRYQESSGLQTIGSYPQFDQDAAFLLRRGNLSSLAVQMLEMIQFSMPKATIRCDLPY